MVIVRQFRGERSQMLARHVDAAQPDQLVAIYHHRLGEGAMNIHSYDPHELPPRSDRKRAGNTATTDSRSQRIRSEEHTSELQSLMPHTYSVVCLQKTTKLENQPQ